MAVKGNVSKRVKIPPITVGNHNAVIFAIWDLGLQWMKKYNSEEKVQKDRIIIAFEVDERIMDGEYDGKRKVAVIEYTNTFYKSNLLRDIGLILGKSLEDAEIDKLAEDLEALIGIPCTINIQHKPRQSDGTLYAKIASVSPLMANSEKLKPETSSEPPQWVKAKQIKNELEEDGTVILEDAKPEREAPEKEDTLLDKISKNKGVTNDVKIVEDANQVKAEKRGTPF